MTTSRTPPPDMTLRPLRHDDDAVDLVFAELSARSRYLRFHSPVTALLPGARELLLDVDGRDRVALVAELRDDRGDRRPIGIARLSRTDTGRAAFAVEVVDQWQRRGVGTALLHALGDLATRLGYLRLHGDVLCDNEVMLWLVRRVFPHSRTYPDDGCLRVEVRLGGAILGVPEKESIGELVAG